MFLIHSHMALYWLRSQKQQKCSTQILHKTTIKTTIMDSKQNARISTPEDKMSVGFRLPWKPSFKVCCQNMALIKNLIKNRRWEILMKRAVLHRCHQQSPINLLLCCPSPVHWEKPICFQQAGLWNAINLPNCPKNSNPT